MLDARVANAWIRCMSINARGDIAGEGAGLATWLPVLEVLDPAALASAVDVATRRPHSSSFD
jgi:hypothetical protein